MKKKTSSLRGQLGAALQPTTTNLPQTTLMLSRRRISQLGTLVSTSTILVADSNLKLLLSTSRCNNTSGMHPVFSNRAARQLILTLANLQHNRMLLSHQLLVRHHLVSPSNSSNPQRSSDRLEFLTSMSLNRQLLFKLHRVSKTRFQHSVSSRITLHQVSGNLVLLLKQHLHSDR